MNIFSGIVTFALVWWVVFFCVLPFNIRTIDPPTDGAMPGAPVNPYLKRKAILTSIIAAVVWLVIYAIIKSDLISYHDIAARMAM